MLQKYNINKIQDWNVDDFRYAMQMIVKRDNDDLFSNQLSKKSGRTSLLKNNEPEGVKKFVSSV